VLCREHVVGDLVERAARTVCATALFLILSHCGSPLSRLGNTVELYILYDSINTIDCQYMGYLTGKFSALQCLYQPSLVDSRNNLIEMPLRQRCFTV
jgi:hypothetical protein